MLTAGVISADAASSGFLRACLQQTGLVQSVVEWSMSPKGEWRLGLGEPVPDVVLLDLGRDPDPYFAFATHLRRLRPTTRIIACSPLQQPDPSFLLLAMRSGVQELFPKPIQPGTLQEALSRFLQETRAGESRPAEKLVVVMGSKGGVGASTVAVNLGVQLAQITKKRVALLDFGRPVGHVSLLLDLQPRFSLRDAVENLDRLDAHFFSGLLTRHATGLEVLAGTSNPEEWQRIPVPALTRVVNLAQSTCDFVLMDFGAFFTPEWGSILRLARMVLLVAEANVPALWTLERQISSTTSLGLDPEKVRVVINRWNRSDEQALKSIEKNIKRPIFARLPNDFRQVSEAENLGVPLHKNHNNPLVTEFRALAGRLAGVQSRPAEKKAGLSQLFLSLRSTR
jgi:pilus assembly protein CpaE